MTSLSFLKGELKYGPPKNGIVVVYWTVARHSDWIIISERMNVIVFVENVKYSDGHFI